MAKNWLNPYYVDTDKKKAEDIVGTSVALKANAGTFPVTLSEATTKATTPFNGYEFDDGETFYNRILNLSGDGISPDGLDIQRYPHVDDVVKIISSREIHQYIVDMVEKANAIGAPVVAGYTPNGGFQCYPFNSYQIYLLMSIGGSNNTIAKTLTAAPTDAAWRTLLFPRYVNDMEVPAEWDSENGFHTIGTSRLFGGLRISLKKGSSTVYIVAPPDNPNYFEEYTDYTSPLFFVKLPDNTSFPVTKDNSEMVPLAIMSAHTGTVTMGDLSSITYDKQTNRLVMETSNDKEIEVVVS